MKFQIWLGLLCAAAFALAGCKKADGDSAAVSSAALFDSSEPTQAQPRLPTIQLYVGPETITAEMAVTPRAEQTGMMFRTNVVENEGMIFVLPYPQQASFWMKNCYIPLSIAYMDDDGVIREIHDMKPQDTNSIVSATSDIRFALETAKGWFQRHNIHPGMVVRSEYGPLLSTFNVQP